MLKIGYHLSAAKGFYAMAKVAESIGTKTFQFFTRNPRGGNIKPFDINDIEKFRSFAEERNFTTILAHAPYTINASSTDGRVRDFARETLRADLAVMEFLPGNFYNLHPGNHLGSGPEVGISQTAELVNEVMNPEQQTTLLFETMAGKGTEIGRAFSELAQLIGLMKYPQKVGICLDTCHIFDAGYDIVHRLDEVLEDFDRQIGLSKLRAIHLNDSKNELGSRKDRHENIGSGKIGLATFVRIINHDKLRHLPFYLETPMHPMGINYESELLKRYYKN